MFITEHCILFYVNEILTRFVTYRISAIMIKAKRVNKKKKNKQK